MPPKRIWSEAPGAKKGLLSFLDNAAAPIANSSEGSRGRGGRRRGARGGAKLRNNTPYKRPAPLQLDSEPDLGNSKYGHLLSRNEQEPVAELEILSRDQAKDLLARVKKRLAELNSSSHNPYLSSGPELARRPAPRIKVYQPDAFSAAIIDYYSKPPLEEWWSATTGITDDVVIPIEIEPFWQRFLPPDSTEYLTAQEARKKRRSERQARFKAAAERVRQKLEPAPAPVIRPSNVAAVFGASFFTDPTKYEQMAQEAQAARKQQHIDDNQSRKLTGDAKWLKAEAKIRKEAETTGHFGALFAVKMFEDFKHRFVVDAAAKESRLSGLALSCSGSYTMVLVEGVESEIAKFTRAMQTRVQWTLRRGGSKREIKDEEYDSNTCELLWTGAIRQPRFKKWSIFDPRPNEIGKLLDAFDIHRFWVVTNSVRAELDILDFSLL